MVQLSTDELVKSALEITGSRLKRQHELVVEFSMTALRARDFEQVIDSACAVVAKGVNARFVKVLRFLPETGRLLLEAGIGWSASEIGTVTLATDDESPAGHAYASGNSVISNHLADEHRFRTPELLVRYGITRAINVPIRSFAQNYGVLEADSADEDAFIETDLVFLEGIANAIAMSHERRGVEAERLRGGLFSESVLNASPDCIMVLGVSGVIEFINETGVVQLEVGDYFGIVGKPWASLWANDETGKVSDAIASASIGESARFEAPGKTLKGKARWWDVSVAPIRNQAGEVERLVAVSRDITERHANEQRLIELIAKQEGQLDSSEIMLKEVHHRVSNSLQLVQALLALQGSLSGDAVVENQLQMAATRMLTIGSVHRRLYEETSTGETNAATYLSSLVEDLAAFCPDRSVSFTAPDIAVPTAKLAPLGLITAELVTNACKYGRGAIRVYLAQTEGAVLITVEDDGDGFPESFPQPKGTGLGMRLVRSYSGIGASAIHVDRSVAFSRISVRILV